jgi:hypothetical protein
MQIKGLALVEKTGRLAHAEVCGCLGKVCAFFLNLFMRSLRLLRAVLGAEKGSKLSAGLLFLAMVAAGAPLYGQQTPAPAPFRFTSPSFKVSESDGVALITVTRTNGFGKMSVDVGVTDGNAVNKTNFKTAPLTTLTFSNYQTALSFPIQITDDAIARTNPASGKPDSATISAGLFLTNARPFKATGPDPSGDEDQTLTGSVDPAGKTSSLDILDNDTTNQFNIERMYFVVGEADREVHVKVVLVQPPGDQASDVSVDYEVKTDFGFALTAGSDYATAGADYQGPADSTPTAEGFGGTLSFGANDTFQEIVIPIVDDQAVEFNEDFHIILSNPKGKITIDNSGTTSGSTAGTTSGSTSGTTSGSTS